MAEKNIFQRGFEVVVQVLAKIKWRLSKEITPSDRDTIRRMLTTDYYVIGVRRSNYLTTFFINMGHWLFTGKWGHYNHVLVNLEDAVNSDSDFRLIEATMEGTKYASFDKVFTRTDGVILLKPTHVTLQEWTTALDKTKTYLGVPYDSLFSLKTENEINCVELIWRGILEIPEYRTKFPHLVSVIETSKTITPQMFIDSGDFEIAFTARPVRQ